MLPGLPVGLDGGDDPILVDEMRRGYIGDYRKSCRHHLARLDEAAATHEILLAPVASLAARREALYGLSVVDALHGAVNPPEAERHLDSIDIAHHPLTVGFRAVDAQPEVGGLVVVILIPAVKLLTGVNVKQIGDFHCPILLPENRRGGRRV